MAAAGVASRPARPEIDRLAWFVILGALYTRLTVPSCLRLERREGCVPDPDVLIS